MYYEIYGKGDPLVLIHGNEGSIADMRYQIPFIAKNYRVIVADSREQGKSTGDGKRITYEQMAIDFPMYPTTISRYTLSHVALSKSCAYSSSRRRKPDPGIGGVLVRLQISPPRRCSCSTDN